jgi:peptide-methionine (S)-S-oxide reductase
LWIEYRSAIFTTTPEQADTAKRVTEEVQAKHFTPNVSFVKIPTFNLFFVIFGINSHTVQDTKIVTTIDSAGPWWEAEAYHQLYLLNNPDGYHCPTHRLHW